MREHELLTNTGLPDELHPYPKDFGGSDFLPAPELEKIIHALVQHFRTRFRYLDEMTVRALWKAKGGQSQGKAVLGKCVKPTGLAGFYAACDFVIWIAADAVRDYSMTRWQIEAALFHELLHTSFEEDDDENKRPIYQGHDVEAFNEEILEYGAWKLELKSAAKAFLQMEMDFSEPSEASVAQSVAEALADFTVPEGIEEIRFEANGKTATVRKAKSGKEA